MSAKCQKRTCHKFKDGSQCDFKSVRSGGILAGHPPDQPLDDGAGGLLRNGTNV